MLTQLEKEKVSLKKTIQERDRRDVNIYNTGH